MAREEPTKADKETYGWPQPPDFMKSNRTPDFSYLEYRAKYIGWSLGDDEISQDWLALLCRGEEAAQSQSLAEIYEIIDAFYPNKPLRHGEKVKTASDEAVRRQNIWRKVGRGLAERWPRLGVDFRRRACGAASGDVRWFSV